MTETSPVTEQSVALERQARLEQINGVLARHDLANPYTLDQLGDINADQLEIKGAEDVIPLGSRGLHLVRIPVQTTRDVEDPDTHIVTPGRVNDFWTFFQTNEAAPQNIIHIPFVIGAHHELPNLRTIEREDPVLQRINEQLGELKLKPLPPAVNQQGDRVLGIEEICQVNRTHFTVVTFNVEEPSGEVVQKPMVFNADSADGYDGMVFSTIIRAPQYGMEPRLIIGDSYRIQLGGGIKEAPRGFYSPRLGGGRRGLRAAFINVPVIANVIRSLTDETGLVSVDHMIDMGTSPQDPTFEASVANYISLDVATPKFEAPDLEATQRFKLDFLTLGDLYHNMGERNSGREIKEPFTLTAVTRQLYLRGILRLSPAGLRAQQEGEKIAYQEVYRFQHGRFLTEAIRGAADIGIPTRVNLGPLPVNTGIARIMPDSEYHVVNWDYFVNHAQVNTQAIRLLSAEQALQAIAYGQFDSVTSAATIKALHDRGHLELDFTAVR